MYQQLFTCTWHFYSQGAVYQRKCSCTFTSCSVLTDNKVNCVFHTHVVCCVFIQSVDEQLWSLRLKTLSFKSGLLSKQNPKPCCLVVGLTPPVVRGGTFILNSFFNLSRPDWLFDQDVTEPQIQLCDITATTSVMSRVSFSVSVGISSLCFPHPFFFCEN